MTINLTKHNTLIHRAITKIAPPNSYRSIRCNLFMLPLAVMAFVAITAFSSCDGVVYEPTLDGIEALFNESCGLKGGSPDSIQRFAAKFQAYINRFPEVQKNPDYYSILGNIEEAAQTYGLTITIYFDPTWDDDTTYVYF